MKVIHVRDVIKEAPKFWLKQYKHCNGGDTLTWNDSKTYGQVRADIGRLDLDKCSVEDINQALGTSGWASLKCDECGERVDKLLRIGEEPTYEARWRDVCESCLAKAADILKSTKAKI